MNFILIGIFRFVLIWVFDTHSSYSLEIIPIYFWDSSEISSAIANSSLFSSLNYYNSPDSLKVASENKGILFNLKFEITQDLEAKYSSNIINSPEKITIPMLNLYVLQKWPISPINQDFNFSIALGITDQNRIKMPYFMLDFTINTFIREKILNSNFYLSKLSIFSDFYNTSKIYFSYLFMIIFTCSLFKLAIKDIKLNFQIIILATLTFQVYCISCSSGYYSYNNLLCLSYCPTGFSQNSISNSCDLINTIALSCPLQNKIVLDQRSGYYVGSSSTNTYPTYDQNDPYPSYQRGYYFKSNSYITTSFKLAPTFSIAMWIKALSGGLVLVKPTPAYQWFVEILASGYPKLSLLLSDSLTTISVIGNLSVLNGWFFVSFDGIINADGTTTISSYIDGVFLDHCTTATALYASDSFLGNLYIGHDNIGFAGFLRKLWIYSFNNHHLDGLQTTGCLGSCTKCPNDSICPNDCSLNQYINGSSCSDCMTVCNKGCISSDTCNLCKTKECATCTEFTGANWCLTCINNAVSDGNGGCTCAANAFWVSLTQSCEICDALCSTCLKTTFFDCSVCSGSYQKVGNVCLNDCPYGFGASCSSVTSPVINQSFDEDFQGNYGIFTTGTNSVNYQFFNSPESFDPIPAYKRGLYFDGNMYLLSSTSVLFSHSFSIGVWLYVITNGDIIEKQTRFVLSSTGKITAIMETPTQATATKILSSGTAFNDWNYLSITLEYISDSTTLRIYINNASVSSLLISDYTYRDLVSTNLMIGKSSFSGFIGFINSFQLWNAPISSFSSYINALCGSGHNCLWSCDLSHYFDGNSYKFCNSCSQGCVRAGNCNICYDLLCSICTGFGSGKCTKCISNASGTPCACILGFMTSSDGLSCVACFNGCSHCTDVTYNKCTACNSGFYLLALTGECLNDCPSNYIANSATNTCVAIQENKLFDLDLNTLKGVIHDKASSIPVITGSTEQFYPDYEVDDPIPAYLRGFYFNGQSSVLRLPKYSNYISPKLQITAPFTISIWLNTETANAALISKHIMSDNYSTLYIISLIGGKPEFSLKINSSEFFCMCSTSLNNYEWSHIVFTFETLSGNSILSSYINGLFDSSSMRSYGTFTDISTHTTIAIGAQISSTTIYNFYKGFIYSIQIFNIIKPISSLSTISCTEACSVCPINQICIPNCKINEYWSGPAYDLCYQCNNKCTKSCRDWRNTCSLCDNLLCNDCNDYSSCKTCKANASNTDSCICDERYVINDINSNTCIPMESGGFKGPDGHFYSCPNLCASCESLLKCTSCLSNASLKNDLCYCNLGFKGTLSCTLNSFSAKLTVLADNSLYLTFSEDLAHNLTASEFVIIIEKIGEVSYKLEKENNTWYYISLAISKEISKESLATLQFLDLSQMISISSGILNSSEISVYLNSYDPTTYSPAIESVSSQSKTTSQTTIFTIAALSIINSSPSSLWCIMNTLQILSYLTLSGIPFSSKMRAFLNNLNSFNLFPNIFQYFIDKNEGIAAYSQAQDFGFDTNLILINQGNDFTLILFSIIALPIVLYFSRCSHRFVGNKFRKTVEDYKYSFYFRFWIQCYLDLGAAAFIGIMDFEFKNMTQVTNFIICMILCFLLIITPLIYFWFSYKNKNQIQMREKTFFASFNTFFYEFRTDRGLITTQYYCLFFARRLIYIINLVYLRNYPQTEVTINIVLSLITVLYLALCWPFEDQISQILNLVTEILILLIMISTIAYLFYLEQNAVAGADTTIIIIVIAIILIQTISSLFVFAKTLYQAIKQKLSKAETAKESNKQQTSRFRKILVL